MDIEGVTTITVTVTNPLPGQLDQYTLERHDEDQCFDVYLTPTQMFGDDVAGFVQPHFPLRTMYTFEQLQDVEVGYMDEVLGHTWEVS